MDDLVGTKLTSGRYYGNVCSKHPEARGLRQRSNNACTLCHQARCAAYLANPEKAAAYSDYKNSAERRAYRQAYRNSAARRPKKVALVRLRKQQISKLAIKDYGPADRARMNRLYELASAYRLLGLEYHVDHIVPLKGANVCGLHVGCNLQLLPAKDNLSKGNRL